MAKVYRNAIFLSNELVAENLSEKFRSRISSVSVLYLSCDAYTKAQSLNRPIRASEQGSMGYNNSDCSIIIKTMDATAAQTANFTITGGLSAGTLHVWATNLNSNTS